MPEILAELRDRRYSPAAWLRFLERSFRRSIEDARSEPALLRSTLRQSALLEGLTLTALLWRCRRHAPSSGRHRRAGTATVFLLLQQLFITLHLGMAQAEHAAPRGATLGVANLLTSLRGVCATLLLIADRRDRQLFVLVLTIGAATDVADGTVARWSGGQSRLGRVLDPMADVAFNSVAVFVVVQQGVLPRWFGGVVLVRFLAPTALGLYRYFGWARPLDAVHTAFGKLAGVLLTATLLLGTHRPSTARRLCLPTSVALLVAGAWQCARSLRASEETADSGLGEQAR